MSPRSGDSCRFHTGYTAAYYNNILRLYSGAHGKAEFTHSCGIDRTGRLFSLLEPGNAPLIAGDTGPDALRMACLLYTSNKTVLLVDKAGKVTSVTTFYLEATNQSAITIPANFKGYLYFPYDNFISNDADAAVFDTANMTVQTLIFSVGSEGSCSYGEIYAFSGKYTPGEDGEKDPSGNEGDLSMVAYTVAAFALSLIHILCIRDRGIAEQHALTLGAGLAAGGMRPFVAIYSTFLQRGLDQIFHDICLQGLPVVILEDRSGLAGEDGQAHQGIYDLGFLRGMPKLSIMAPRNIQALKYKMCIRDRFFPACPCMWMLRGKNPRPR